MYSSGTNSQNILVAPQSFTFGFDKTLKLIASKVYMINLRVQLENCLPKCIVCQVSKRTREKYIPWPLTFSNKYAVPGNHFGRDENNNLFSRSKFNYILIWQHRAKRFLTAKPMIICEQQQLLIFCWKMYFLFTE